MVGAHLASLAPIDFPHFLLDERVARICTGRYAAVPLNNLLCVPGQPRVVDDRAPGSRSGRLPRAAHEVITLNEWPCSSKKNSGHSRHPGQPRSAFGAAKTSAVG